MLRPRMCRRRCRCWGLCSPAIAWWPLRMTLPMRLRAALSAATWLWWRSRRLRRLLLRPRALMLRLMLAGRICGGSSIPSAGLAYVCPICVRWVGRRVRPVRCSWWITPWQASLGAIRCVWVPSCRSRHSTVCVPALRRASSSPLRWRARSLSAIACASCGLRRVCTRPFC